MPLAVLGAVRPPRGRDEAQLSAENVGVGDGEVIIADGSPLAAVEQLHPALVVLPRVSGQPEPEPRGVLGLGGRGSRWRGRGRGRAWRHGLLGRRIAKQQQQHLE